MALELDDSGIPHPRQTLQLLGHQDAQASFLDAYNGDRLHHGWLICGPKGTGKATLAYMMARFLLTHPPIVDEGPSLFGEPLEKTPATSLNVDPMDPVCQRILSGGHGDLITVQRSEDDRGKLRSEIVIGDIRRVQEFFAKTASEGGWRIAIIDSADEMNRNAANGLLKILEEPPKNTLLILLAHAPGRLLPTIVSRCRKLTLKPLAQQQVIDVLSPLYPDLTPDEQLGYAILSEGSPGAAVTMVALKGLELYQELLQQLSGLPHLKTAALHRFAEDMASRNNTARYELFCNMLSLFLNRLVRHAGYVQQGQPSPIQMVMEGEGDLMMHFAHAMPLDRWVEVWEKVSQLIARTDGLNLDRKQVILNIFDLLAQSVRSK